MLQKPLFSVIILHYNQEEFIYNAIDSVLSQTYDNIELIIADDYSEGFNKQTVEDYIAKNKKGNLKEFSLQVNDTNLGTVKNANRAIEKCSGEYILMFAADDCLYDFSTLSNFEITFSKLPEDRLVLSAQCYMYDEKLEKVHNEYVDLNTAYNLNTCSAEEQYKKMVFSCIFAMGATAFKRKIFEQYGLFNERYVIIEDWSYFLYITRSGVKMTFSNFGGLKHRDGGVSHYKRDGLPPHVIAFKNDLLLISEYEIIPFLSIFPLADQVKLLDKYEGERNDFYKLFVPNIRKKRISLIAKNPKVFIRKMIWSFLTFSKKGLKLSLIFLTVVFGIWVSTGLISSVFTTTPMLSSFKYSTVFADNPLNFKIYSFIITIIPVVLLINAFIVLVFAVLIVLYGFRKFYRRYFSNKL